MKISSLPTKFFHLFQFIIPQFVVFVEKTFHPPGYLRLEPLSGQVLGAGGLLVQPLPDCPAENVDYVMAQAEAIPHLTRRLSEGEGLKDIVLDLFPEGDVSFTEELSPAYRCDCSRERMERALMSLGRDELHTIIEEDGQAELSCHFCNSRYAFTKAELESLLQEGAGA